MVSLSEAARALAKSRRPRRLVCPVCGVEFEGVGRRKYCSPRCKFRAQWRRYFARHAEERRARQRERYRQKKAASGAGDSQA